MDYLLALLVAACAANVLVYPRAIAQRAKSLTQRARRAEQQRDSMAAVLRDLYSEAGKTIDSGDPVAPYVRSAIESGLTEDERLTFNVK